jgi:RNA polymerase sigma-70 factor (ECF subfamily)
MAAPSPTFAAATDLRSEIESLHSASFGWALACCGRNRDEASEVLQQSYCKVLTGSAHFDGRSSLRTWLFGVIRLTAREHRRWSWLFGSRTAAPELQRPPAPDEVAEAREEAARLSAALAALAARQREVLHLVFYEGLTISEAAGVMGVSLGSARQHYERGKKNLHAALTQTGGHP